MEQENYDRRKYMICGPVNHDRILADFVTKTVIKPNGNDIYCKIEERG